MKGKIMLNLIMANTVSWRIKRTYLLVMVGALLWISYVLLRKAGFELYRNFPRPLKMGVG